MKIAVMMRAMDHRGGLSVFTEGLVQTLLQLDEHNSYALLYKEAKFLGRFSTFRNAKELLIRSRHKLVWDQVLVPFTAWREGAHIIFNPKFSIPLFSHCPVAMGLQEPAWWAIPEHHTRLDVLYMRTMLPLYCRKSSHFFPWTQFVLDENRKYLRLPLRNATVTYGGVDANFHVSYDPKSLEECRSRYGLPEKFLLSVTRVENLANKSASFSGTKNVETTLRAFAKIREQVPHKLVIVGRHVKEYLMSVGWKESQFKDIHFTGFIPHAELAKVYNLADLLVMPSFYEGFGLVMVEAMTCGCPVVASDTGPCPEVSAGAAVLASPHDASDFAIKMLDVLTDENLKSELRQKSLKRAKYFNWERTARLTLEGLEDVVKKEQMKRSPRATKRSKSYLFESLLLSGWFARGAAEIFEEMDCGLNYRSVEDAVNAAAKVFLEIAFDYLP
jgi:glycosyltransferase involved in cell wall biosynthesis